MIRVGFLLNFFLQIFYCFTMLIIYLCYSHFLHGIRNIFMILLRVIKGIFSKFQKLFITFNCFFIFFFILIHFSKTCVIKILNIMVAMDMSRFNFKNYIQGLFTVFIILILKIGTCPLSI